MPEKESLTERGRALEDEYFRKKDQELIEKMRRAAATADAQAEMGKRTGLSDPATLAELRALGFSPETVVLLPLVPALQVAWAEGGVTPAERTAILNVARARGVAEGSAADRQLSEWLERRPSDDLFAHATRLVRAMLATPAGGGTSAEDLVRDCESIAAASGGLLGFGRVSAEERHLLATLAAELKGREG